MLPKVLDFASMRALYESGTTPVEMVEALKARMEGTEDLAIFIAPASLERLKMQAEALMERAPAPNSLPLWGLPFAVKDNIDAEGLATTAACPAYAYEPDRDATVVARLRAAGAIVIGKTNLDQFATGLNGTRSPYGAPRSVFDADYVSGGSSSGSAVAVASGLAAFALGTDTAGSGRVPAAFNNLVGIKPTPGRVPNAGVVPACRSVDVVTVFAASVGDGIEARRAMDGFDPADIFSRRAGDPGLPARPRLGVPAPEERNFFGNAGFELLYEEAIARAEALGADIVTFDYRPFREAAALLYEGPWVAERYAAIEDFIAGHADDMDPTVRAIVEGAGRYSAVDAFKGRYALEGYKRLTEAEWAKCDALMLPTSPTNATVEAMLADPVRLNAQFGLYTNFVNLMGLAAIAVPAGFTTDGLPFGVTLVGPTDTDEALAPFAHAMHAAARCGMATARDATPPAPPARRSDDIELVVVGAHLTGMPLNHELTALGARFVRQTRTAPDYRLFALAGTVPAKPGLAAEPGSSGPGIEVEVWRLSPASFGSFVARIPSPLGIGKVRLEDGSLVSGFLCEAAGLEGAEEVTQFGGWRAFVASKAAEGA